MSLPPDDSPCGRALRYSQMMTDFCCAPFPAAPESPAPAWLTTAEGMAYMQAMARGDDEGALQIFADAGARTTWAIINTMFDDIVPPTIEEKTDG